MDLKPVQPYKKSSLRSPTLETGHGSTPHDKDPSLSTSAPAGKSTNPNDVENSTSDEKKSFKKYMYNSETKEYCGRTCKNWIYILLYAIIYIIFLSTYTLMFLYFSLLLMKHTTDFRAGSNKIQLLTYSEKGIGLTMVPPSGTSEPLIMYKRGDSKGYEKYVKALDKMLKHSGSDLSRLGPCGKAPYGYGEEPCVVVKIARQFYWKGEPLQGNSTVLAARAVPSDVQQWMKMDKTKLWLKCDGYHDYDKDHIGKMKYYPDPPGFDSSLFPLGPKVHSPLVAIQMSKFTLGISLAIECKLWYHSGPSAATFVLYIEP